MVLHGFLLQTEHSLLGEEWDCLLWVEASQTQQPAFPVRRVSGAACPLSVRCWICSAKGSFQGDMGNVTAVSHSAVCHCGGGEHPEIGDFCSLLSAVLQPQDLGGRCHMLPFGTVAVGAQSPLLSSALAEGAGSVPAGMLPLARDGSRRGVVVKGQTCLCLAVPCTVVQVLGRGTRCLGHCDVPPTFCHGRIRCTSSEWGQHRAPKPWWDNVSVRNHNSNQALNVRVVITGGLCQLMENELAL